MRIRTSQTIWSWPYELPAEPGVVAGVVTLNRNGLHVPANCPPNVRADIRIQLANVATSTAGTVSKQLVVDSLLSGIPAC
jgi:predicted regulator of Ras-like GTPase activity (Roadblock/LC7/MglB family)